jgi:hypothetical protein
MDKKNITDEKVKLEHGNMKEVMESMKMRSKRQRKEEEVSDNTT